MLLIFFFSHTPSTVVTISPQEHQQKVSVILCFVQTSPTELVAAENNLQKGKIHITLNTSRLHTQSPRFRKKTIIVFI